MSDDSKVAARRFSILVPEPKARLNMGKPEDGANAFGHPGISLQAENSLYVDVGSVVHVQAEKDIHFEAYRHFEQFAQKNMNLAALQNASFAANGKLILAAGAGQGFTPTIPYAKQDPTWLDYNNLRLHHLVDSVSTRLKELFYGEEWQDLQSEAKSDQKAWFTGDAPHTGDGMLHEIHQHLMELGLHKTHDKVAIAALLEPMTWSPDYVSAMGKKLPWNWGSSEYKWVVASDPYAPSPVNGTGFYKVVTKAMAYLLQTGVLLRRLSDALEALIPAIMEFDVIARIRGLAQATKAMNEAILASDPKKWAQYNPTDPDGAWAQVKKQSFESFEKETWTKSRAELTTSPEPFRIGACDGTTLGVLDAEGGHEKELDFAVLMTPATLALKLSGEYTRIEVELSASGELELGEAVARWDAASKTWSHGAEPGTAGLPGGFTCTAHGVVTKGGKPFEAKSPNGGLAFDDLTFEEGKATLVVDGVPHPIASLASVRGSASARASALAQLLGAAGGCRASASGDTVTVTSLTGGARSTLALRASEEVLEELGLDGEASGGATDLSAAELKEKLEGKGSYEITLQGSAPHQWLKIEHKLEGTKSYLEFSGPVATAIFGKTPAMSKGSDPLESSKALAPTLKALFEILEGNAFMALVRPAFDAVQQVVEVWGKIEEAAKSLQNVLAPPKPKPHVGLVSGIGGITLTTRGNVSAVGQTVTLVAAGAVEEPDSRKFIPLVEDLIEKIEHVNDKIHEWTKNPMWDAIDSKLQGNVNLVSSANTTVVANGPLRMVSKEAVAIYGRSATFQVADGLKLGAHKGALRLHGKTVEVGTRAPGSGAGAKKQEATTSVVVNATTGVVALRTNSVGAWLEEGGKRVALGSRKPDTRLDVAKVHLAIEPTKLVAGNDQGKLAIDGGEVELRSKSKLQLGANNLTDLETSGGMVKVNGKLDVGGVLVVNGLPGAPRIDVAEKLKATADDAAAAAEKAALVAQHAALEASVAALDQALATARTALEQVRENEGFIWFGQDKAIVAAEGVVAALAKQRETLESKRAAVAAELVPVNDDAQVQ